MSDLCIAVNGIELSATWATENPMARKAIEDVLPLAGDATRWGDELYFSVPVEVAPEQTREEVSVGTVAYWPGGNALCLFWGPTPASQHDEPRAAAPVAVLAEIDDVDPLENLDGGAHVSVSAMEE